MGLWLEFMSWSMDWILRPIVVAFLAWGFFWFLFRAGFSRYDDD